jgi:hypothetical protein
VARATHDGLADALSAVLRELQAAVVERFQDGRGHGARRWRVQGARHRKPPKHTVVAALRRLLRLA